MAENKIAVIKPKGIGRPALNPRFVFNAILWILRSGGRWRDLPSRYGNWNSIYHKFRLWCNCNIFEKILQIINQEAEESALIEIDSTFCKCSTLKNQSIGSSRGGKNTKIREGGKVCIPDKAKFKIQHDFDEKLYKHRNIIERFFQRIKNFRHTAMRYDKMSDCFLNFEYLAASVIHF